MELNLLYEDDYVLVAVKPAKMPAQKDLSGDLDMVTALTDYLENKTKKEKPYLGLIHRIDRPVSGIMVFAKTPKANQLLSEQIRLNQMSKEYRVVVSGIPKENKRELIDYVYKQSNNLSKIVKENTPDAKKAILNYACIGTITHEEFGEISLLNVELITGRHHQIRVQLSHAGLPIWGDTKYNKRFFVEEQRTTKKAWYQIALCAYKLQFNHPKTGKLMSFIMEPLDFPFDQFKG